MIKLCGEQSRSDEYVKQIQSNISALNNIIDSINSGCLSLNNGIDDISKYLYSAGFSLFGKTENKKTRCKFKSPWFTNENLIVRKDSRLSHRKYELLSTFADT